MTFPLARRSFGSRSRASQLSSRTRRTVLAKPLAMSYDRITTLLREAGIAYLDYGGQTAATWQGVQDGIALARREDTGAVVEIGGASAMDHRPLPFSSKSDWRLKYAHFSYSSRRSFITVLANFTASEPSSGGGNRRSQRYGHGKGHRFRGSPRPSGRKLVQCVGPERKLDGVMVLKFHRPLPFSSKSDWRSARSSPGGPSPSPSLSSQTMRTPPGRGVLERISPTTLSRGDAVFLDGAAAVDQQDLLSPANLRKLVQ